MTADESSPGLELEAPGAEPRIGIGPVAIAAAMGPCAWFVDLGVRFLLVELGVARERESIVVAVGLALWAVAVISAIASHRLRQRARGQRGEAEFAATLGVALNAFSALVIFAALVPHLFFDGAGAP